MPTDELEDREEAHAAPEQGVLPLGDTDDGLESKSPTGTGIDPDLGHIIEGLDVEDEPDSDAEGTGAATPPLPFEDVDEAAGGRAGETPDALDAERPLSAPPDEQPEPEVGESAAHIVRPPLWPFVVYDLVWVGFAAVLTWQFLALPPDAAVYASALYEWTLYVGIALTLCGPLLILLVWALARGGEEGRGKELLVSTLAVGAIATLLGVFSWWTALLVVDYVRLGQLF